MCWTLNQYSKASMLIISPEWKLMETPNNSFQSSPGLETMLRAREVGDPEMKGESPRFCLYITSNWLLLDSIHYIKQGKTVSLNTATE